MKELIEKWKLQREIEEKFLKRLEMLDWSSREQIRINFRKLWETKERCNYHVSKRIRDGHVTSEEEFIKKTFEALANHTSVILYEAPKWKNADFWHKIFYSRDCWWVVIIGETGTILTAFKVEEGRFLKSLKRMKDAGYRAYEGEESEQIKEIAKGVLRRLSR